MSIFDGLHKSPHAYGHAVIVMAALHDYLLVNGFSPHSLMPNGHRRRKGSADRAPKIYGFLQVSCGNNLWTIDLQTSGMLSISSVYHLGVKRHEIRLADPDCFAQVAEIAKT